MSAKEVADALVDLDVARLTGDEIEGGYRSLCAAMLLRTAQEFGCGTRLSRDGINNRQAARHWLFKSSGIITLTEACQACDLDRQSYINGIVENSDRLRANPESCKHTPNRWATGKV